MPDGPQSGRESRAERRRSIRTVGREGRIPRPVRLATERSLTTRLGAPVGRPQLPVAPTLLTPRSLLLPLASKRAGRPVHGVVPEDAVARCLTAAAAKLCAHFRRGETCLPPAVRPPQRMMTGRLPITSSSVDHSTHLPPPSRLRLVGESDPRLTLVSPTGEWRVELATQTHHQGTSTGIRFAA